MDWYRKIVLVFAIDIIYHNVSQQELMEFGQTFDELSRPYFSYNGTFHTICTHDIQELLICHLAQLTLDF